MRFVKGHLFKTKEYVDSSFVSCPISDYDKVIYTNFRLLLRVFLLLPVCYFLGDFLYYKATSLNNLIEKYLLFFLILIASSALLQIPFEFIKAICINKFNKITMKYLHKKRIIICKFNGSLSKSRYITSNIMPILISIVIIIPLMCIFPYSIILLAILGSIFILGSENILNSYLALGCEEPIKSYYLLYEENPVASEETTELNVESNNIT